MRPNDRGRDHRALRILLVQLSASFAGTERHAVELANALAEEHAVALLLRTRPSEPDRWPPYDAMRRSVSDRVRVYATPRAMPVLGLWQALLAFRPEVVHAHHERSARIAAGYAPGVPVLATIHMHWRARDFGRCDGVVCLTAEAASEVPASYRGQRFVIGNWVLPHPVPAAPMLAALRAELGLRPDDFVIGTVARLEPVKGVASLLAAFRDLALPRGRLVVVGEGSERAALQAHADALGLGGQVAFTGFRADVRDLYALFDLFVLNSSDEPYGLAILEAAAAGVPVVATATAGARAIAATLPLDLVPVGDRTALTQAMRRAVTKPGRQLGFRSGFAIGDRLPQIVDAYRRLIAARRAATPGRRALRPVPTRDSSNPDAG